MNNVNILNNIKSKIAGGNKYTKLSKRESHNRIFNIGESPLPRIKSILSPSGTESPNKKNSSSNGTKSPNKKNSSSNGTKSPNKKNSSSNRSTTKKYSPNNKKKLLNKNMSKSSSYKRNKEKV